MMGIRLEKMLSDREPVEKFHRLTTIKANELFY